MVKRVLQPPGTSVVRSISGLSVGDATSGFRAYSRPAALSLVITTPYTYTLESLIQAGNGRLALANVPVQRNASVRPSRLFGSMWGYVRRNSRGAVPGPVVLLAAAVLLDDGRGPGPRAPGRVAALDDRLPARRRQRHMQSIILGAVLAISGVQVFALGVVADQISSLRQIGIRNLRETRETPLRHPPSG